MTPLEPEVAPRKQAAGCVLGPWVAFSLRCGSVGHPELLDKLLVSSFAVAPAPVGPGENKHTNPDVPTQVPDGP